MLFVTYVANTSVSKGSNVCLNIESFCVDHPQSLYLYLPRRIRVFRSGTRAYCPRRIRGRINNSHTDPVAARDRPRR